MGERAEIRLRLAQPADRNLLEYWDTQPHVMDSGSAEDHWNWAVALAETAPWREMLIAEADGRPVGFLQIIDPAEETSGYWGEVAPHLRAIDIWIGAAEDLSKGYGTQMMCLALKRCFADPKVTAVLIDPLTRNVRARRFYERLGFQPVGRRMFGADDCMVYQVRRGDLSGA